MGMSLLLTLLLSYAGLCLALNLMQRSMLYFPQPRSEVPGTELMRLQTEVELLVTVAGRARPSALIYLGGNAEDVGQSVPELAAAFPTHAIHALHYRGYGGSGGAPSEAALVGDALALVDQLQPRYAEFVLVGRSLGSGVAVQVASQRQVARLILLTPYDSLDNVAARHYPIFPVRWLLRDRFRSWQHAAVIQAPTLIVAAEQDQVIPPAHAEALHQHFPPGVARLETLAGADHNDLTLHPRYSPLLREWMAAAGID
jgi:pimeloyl-ACP methyl ester carboxylesterase